MLTISENQMRAMAEHSTAGFEKRMVAHLSNFFPEQCAAMGTQDVIAAVREGISKSAAYGITRQRDVCKYIDLMFTLGREFDTEIPWAAPILRQTGAESENRMTRLVQVTLAAITRRSGPVANNLA